MVSHPFRVGTDDVPTLHGDRNVPDLDRSPDGAERNPGQGNSAIPGFIGSGHSRAYGNVTGSGGFQASLRCSATTVV